MKIGVSAYSFAQYVNAGKMTQLDCVAKSAEMGFEGMDFTELKPFEGYTLDDQKRYAEEIRREAERCGIEIVAYTVGANLYHEDEAANAKEVARLKGQLDVAAILGARVFRHDVCSWGQKDGRMRAFDKMLITIAKNAREVSEYGQSLGIVTCSENHGYVAQDSDRLEKLYAEVDYSNYALLIDMGNFACADEDSVKAVSRLANYAVHVHAKDFIKKTFGEKVDAGAKSFPTRGANRLVACAIGDGDIPVAQCIAILKRAGYNGYVAIEFEGAEECVAAIARGRDNLQKYINA